MNKNDYKYIVKRIIVGVVIFLIIMLFKNNVKAETRNAYLYNMNRPPYITATFQTQQNSFYLSGVGSLQTTNTVATDIELPYNDDFIKLNIGYASTSSNPAMQCVSTFLLKNNDDNLYMLIQTASSNTTFCNNLSSGNYGLDIHFATTYDTRGSYYLKDLTNNTESVLSSPGTFM